MKQRFTEMGKGSKVTLFRAKLCCRLEGGTLSRLTAGCRKVLAGPDYCSEHYFMGFKRKSLVLKTRSEGGSLF